MNFVVKPLIYLLNNFQESSHDFLQTVAANIKTIVLPDNEIVQHAGDIGRDMYILSKVSFLLLALCLFCNIFIHTTVKIYGLKINTIQVFCNLSKILIRVIAK